MQISKLLYGLFALAIVQIAQPGHAVSKDAYTELVEAIASDENAMQAFEAEMARAAEEWGKQADFAEIENECPGFLEGFILAMRPSLRKGQLDDYGWYRAQLDTLVRAELTEAEAREGAAFFNSPLGRKLMGRVWEHNSYENSVAEAIADPEGDTSREAFEADRRATRDRLNNAFTPEEHAATKDALSGGFGRKLVLLQPRINSLMFEMYNRSYPPEIQAELDAVTDAFVESHFAACAAG